MITLDELLKVKAAGEPVEVYVIGTGDTYHPENELMPFEWNEYEVKSFYSIWNNSKHETKTHVEVLHIE